jgi:multiple sugar transport system ATP-binding protein
MAALSIRALSKRYANLEVLKGIDLDIESGEFTVLVGPSGCGKSTLLNIVAGLDRPSAGTVTSRQRTATSPWCSSPMRSIHR